MDAGGGDLYRELGIRNVLLVGNDAWIEASLTVFFRIQGCLVKSASDIGKATALLAGDPFDLILCDHVLPDGDGLTFLKTCGNRQRSSVRLLIAASPSHLVFEEASRSGVHDVIPKPFRIETMEQSLRRHRLTGVADS